MSKTTMVDIVVDEATLRRIQKLAESKGQPFGEVASFILSRGLQTSEREVSVLRSGFANPIKEGAAK